MNTNQHITDTKPITQEQADWEKQQTKAKQNFLFFVRDKIDKKLGYEDWLESGLKSVYDYVDIPSGGWWIPYETKDPRGKFIGAKVYNYEGLLVNQFEFTIE